MMNKIVNRCDSPRKDADGGCQRGTEAVTAVDPDAEEFHEGHERGETKVRL